MKKIRTGLQIAYLIVGALAVCEFVFVRGMFTWMIAVAAVGVLGVANMIAAARDRDAIDALGYFLCSVALCMGYFVLLGQGG